MAGDAKTGGTSSGPLREEEVYRELEAIKLRLREDAADEAMTRESLWLLGQELRDLASSLRSGR
jgi:hypothetical protein